MMHSVTSVRALDGFRLEVIFEDGVAGVLSLKDRLFGPMFEPLRDPDLFSRVQVDEFGAVCWPNGADLAPDALYDRIASTRQPVSPQLRGSLSLHRFQRGGAWISILVAAGPLATARPPLTTLY